MSGQPESPLRIGIKESFRSAIGIVIPSYLLFSAFGIASGEAIGVPVIFSGATILTLGIFFLIGVEILRRFVLMTRFTSRGSRAVTALRTVIWLLVVGALPTVALNATAVFTHCFGRACGNLDMVFLVGMLVWSVLALCMVPLGYQLLHDAAWLRAERPSTE